VLRDKIKEKCKERGISIRQLEREAGLSGGTVKKWNQFNPRANSLLKVSKVLGVSIDELMEGKA